MDSTTGSSRGVIPILLVAAFVVILNETTMNVALNSIMTDLGVNERTAQWLTTAFMLTMAVVIPVTGWLLDRLPTRRVFQLALSLFSLGTLIAAVSPTFALLLMGRVVQASGTAIMMPLLMTTIMQLVPANKRGQTMGTISMVIAVAPATGPTLSGFILELGSWRLIFWFMLPVALLMLALGHWRLRNVGEKTRTPLDLISVLLTGLGFGPLIYGFSLIGADQVEFWEPMLAIGIGVGGLAAFMARQFILQARDAALLDLRTFSSATFTVAVLMMSIAMMAMFGTVIMLPLILQRAFGMDPLQVGLMLLPGGIAMGVMSPLVGRLYDKVGPRVLVVPASFVVLGAFLYLSTISPDMPWWGIMLAHSVMSVSFAAIFTPLFTVGLGSLPKNLYSHGSAVIGTVQQVAGAAGTALFVTVFAMQTAAARPTAPTEAAAMLEGAHWAFLGAGAVWTAALIAGFFLRKPEEETAAISGRSAHAL